MSMSNIPASTSILCSCCLLGFADEQLSIIVSQLASLAEHCLQTGLN